MTDGTTRYIKTSYATSNYYLAAALPPDVSCQYCVIQWTYVTGNGSGEIYKNCADVIIS